MLEQSPHVLSCGWENSVKKRLTIGLNGEKPLTRPQKNYYWNANSEKLIGEETGGSSKERPPL